MKNYIKIILLIILNLIILTGCFAEKEKEAKEVQIGKVGSNEPIERAMVSKMLALANYTKNDIISLERVINFNDTDQEKWYDKYINAVYIKGDMSGALENEFMPNESLSLQQTQYLIDKYDEKGDIKIKIDDENKDKPISYELWCEIFTKIMINENIKEETFTILATSKTTSKIQDGYAMTDNGIYCFEGIDIDKYLGVRIKVLVNELDVIAITEVLEIEPTLTRCYIESIKNNKVTIYVGGINKVLTMEEIEIPEYYIGKIADIKVRGNTIIEVLYYENEINGEIKKINQNTININGENYVLDENFKLYSQVYESIKYKDLSDLYVGQTMCQFYTKGNENKIYAGIIKEEANFDTIRVLISDNNFENSIFEQMEIYSEGGLSVYVKGEIKTYASEDRLIIKEGADFGIEIDEIIRLELNDGEKGFKIENLARGYEDLVYFGSIEIIKTRDGYLLINEIEFEKYLESVLANNGANYTNIEMLKTMAVLNRSTAIATIKENLFKELGANIDDKILIYNNLAITENIKRAVEETALQFLTYDGEIIKPNYFAYSAGVIANSGEIWAGAKFKEFPTESKGYLLYKKLFSDEIYDDLQDGVNANIFFKSKDIDCIEVDSDWFRWTTTLEQENIQNLNLNINNIYEMYPNFIKTYVNGEYIYKPIESIGKIKDINVVARGEAGNVMQIEIVGEENQILLMTDSAIKAFFCLEFIINNNGERIDSMKTLPSTYFVFDKIYDNDGYLQKVSFYGGGYGHGVGLSLYGAEKLAESGEKYYEIINYFYKNIIIENID